MILLLCILAYLIAVSRLAYHAFAHDKLLAMANSGVPRSKEYAQHKMWRTPEAKLLFYAMIGGWPGAKYAQKKLRHKTRKQPFARQLNEVGMVQGAALGLFILIATAMTLLTPEAGAISAQTAPLDVQPAGAPPLKSLRPPAVRPAT